MTAWIVLMICVTTVLGCLALGVGTLVLGPGSQDKRLRA